MVKISGEYNTPGGFNFIPGATYIGDSRLLGLAIFLDQCDSSTVLLRFRDQKTKKVDYREFARVVNFIEAFSSSQGNSYESSDPNPLKVSIVLLETSRILLRLEDSSTLLFPLEFFETLNILVAIRKKMEVIVRKRLERSALLDESSLHAQLRNWGGLLVFALLSVLDLVLLICLFFWPALYLHWLLLTLFLATWLLLFKPAWSTRVWPATLAYLNEELLTDLSHIHFPRRAVEITLIIIILLVFYFFFSSDAANIIFKYYKRSSLP